jgi:hypothetical protein
VEVETAGAMLQHLLGGCAQSLYLPREFCSLYWCVTRAGSYHGGFLAPDTCAAAVLAVQTVQPVVGIINHAWCADDGLTFALTPPGKVHLHSITLGQAFSGGCNCADN